MNTPASTSDSSTPSHQTSSGQVSNAARLSVSRRQRGTPYTARIESLGVSDYSIVNHTILPKGFGYGVENDYWHLREHVQIWDVTCQRQVEITGVDAAYLVQLMTPRNMSNAAIGQCLYAPLIDDNAGMLNDPIILKLADDRFWLSIADSDVLLWAKGLAVGLKLDVKVIEPDVSPLAIQGPKADALMEKVFGDVVNRIRFFRFAVLPFNDHPLVVARSGYSRQGGFEIYLDDSSLGLQLWDALWEAGQEYGVRPGSPNVIERAEGGLLSYGNEFTRENNPYECGMEQYCHPHDDIEFIGKDALWEIAKQGPQRQIRGILFDGDKCPAVAKPWPLIADGNNAGHITTAIWSPRLKSNIALAMIEKPYWSTGQELLVTLPDAQTENGTRKGIVQPLPLD